MDDFTRRMFLGAAALGPAAVSVEAAQVSQDAAAPAAQPPARGASSSGPARSRSKPWNPKLGILANFSEANVRFAKSKGFASIGLFAHYKTTLDLTAPLPQQRVDQVRNSIRGVRSLLIRDRLPSAQSHCDRSG